MQLGVGYVDVTVTVTMTVAKMQPAAVAVAVTVFKNAAWKVQPTRNIAAQGKQASGRRAARLCSMRAKTIKTFSFFALEAFLP